MAEVRSDTGAKNGDFIAGQHPSLTTKSPDCTSGGEPKVMIHAKPPESRPHALQNFDATRPDDLTRIRGISRGLADKLNRMGITHYDQIANWSSTDIRSLSAALQLGQTIYRQFWIEQAARLVLRQRPADTNVIERPAKRATTEPTIAMLVATAAAAIRARTRIHHTDENENENEIVEQLDQAAQPPDGSRRLGPVSLLSEPELNRRIAAGCAGIRATLEIVTAEFPRADVSVRAAGDLATRPTEDLQREQHEAPPASIETFQPAPVVEPEPGPGPRPGVETERVSGSETEPESAARTETRQHPETPVEPDDLRLIVDMPERVAERLGVLGVRYFSEIAAFDAEDVAVLSEDCALGDRAYRECWIEQAALLATGKSTKGAARRAKRKPTWIVPYPTGRLHRDPDALAALPRPLVTPIRREPSTISPPPITVMASAENSDAREQRPVSPREPAPSTPEGWGPPAPSYLKPDQDALPQVRSSAKPPPAAASVGEPDREHPDIELFEEAEVTIRPRERTAGKPTCDPVAATVGQPTSPLLSQESKLSAADLHAPALAGADNDRGQAAYLRHVAEASVEIVASPRRASQSSSSEKAASGRPIARHDPENRRSTVEPGAVSRFLKALRGR